jgi:hypothetical protein
MAAFVDALTTSIDQGPRGAGTGGDNDPCNGNRIDDYLGLLQGPFVMETESTMIYVNGEPNQRLSTSGVPCNGNRIYDYLQLTRGPVYGKPNQRLLTSGVVMETESTIIYEGPRPAMYMSP